MAGSVSTIVETGGNLREMEERKKNTFNKTNIVRIGKGKNKERSNYRIKERASERGGEVQILGNWINEKGNMTDQIEEIESRVEAITSRIIKLTKEEELGKLSTDARLVVYKRTAVPTLINNLECWTRIGRKDMERLERVQGKMLKRILKLPKTTPTWGIIKETGIWPMEMRVVYHR